MDQKYHKELALGTVVFVTTKDNNFYQPAKIALACECIYRDAPNKDARIISRLYEYSVRTINYESKPFENFIGTDTTFLNWNEIVSFKTMEEFEDYFKFSMGGIYELKRLS